jgi:hypothetical protein
MNRVPGKTVRTGTSRFRESLSGAAAAISPLLCLLAAVAAAAALSLPFTPPPSNTPESFRFAVYGDVQGNHRGGHEKLVRLMLRDELLLVAHPGDMSPNKGRNYDRHFYPGARELAERVSFFPAAGNHDVNWGSRFSRVPFRQFFAPAFEYLGGLPGNDHLRIPDAQKLWYQVRIGPALFIALDSNLFIDEGKYRNTHAFDTYQGYADEQGRWLRQVLESADRDSTILYRFVFFHHSPFASYEQQPFFLFGLGGHPGHREMVVRQQTPAEDNGRTAYLLDLLRLHRVNAVFTGHEHLYERWQEVIRRGGEQVHAIHWIVTGLGGVKPRGRPKYEPEEIRAVLNEPFYRHYLARITELNPDWSSELIHLYPTPEKPDGRFHHYLRVTVDGSGIQFEAVDSEGVVRDGGQIAGVPSR